MDYDFDGYYEQLRRVSELIGLNLKDIDHKSRNKLAMHRSQQKEKAAAVSVLSNNQRDLYIACRDGANEICTDLVNRGTDVNFIVQDLETLDYMTPLFVACENAHPTCVDLLLAHGANVNAGHVRFGETPLIATAEEHFLRNTPWFINDRLQCMRSLLDAGAMIDHISTTDFTLTALMSAAWNFPLTKMLVDAGANVNILNNDNCSVLFLVINSPDVVEVVQLLMQCGADIDAVDVTERTPLHWACGARGALYPVAVNTFLHHGADIDIVDPEGKTALQMATSCSFTQNRVAVLQHLATCSQTRLEASSADWIRLALNERNRPQMTLGSMGTARQQRRRKHKCGSK